MAQTNSTGKWVRMANGGKARKIRSTNPTHIALLGNPRGRHSGRASRGGHMAAKKRKRPMPAGLKRYWAAHKRKKNGPSAHHHSRPRTGYKKARAKPRARNAKPRYTKRRRRNPESLRGLPTTIVWLGAGAVGTRFVMSKLPWKIPIGGVWGTWLTEVAVAIIGPKLLHRFVPGFVNQNAAALMMYGGLGSAGADAFDILKNKMPGLFQSVAVPAPQAPGAAAVVPGGVDQWAAGQTPAVSASPGGVADLVAVRQRLMNPMGRPGFSGLGMRGLGDMVLWRAR